MQTKNSVGLFPLVNLGVLLLAACSAGEGADHKSMSEFVVRNSENGLWEGSAAWSLHEVRRIGTTDSQGPDAFGRVVDLAFDGLGRIWIADAQAHTVHVFESNGHHVRSIGSKGAGPGEFQQLSGMDWSLSGQLWVQDPGNDRYTVFDTAGTMVTTHRRPAGMAMVPWPGGFDESGYLYDVAPIVSEDGTIETGLVRLSPDMVKVDTFRLPRFEGKFFELVSGTEQNRSINRVAVPFNEEQVWAVDQHGTVWTSQTDKYRLIQQNFNGDTIRIVERKHEPVRVTSAELDAALEEYSWFTNQGGKMDRSRIPRVKPALSNFFFSPDGYAWVFASSNDDGTHPIDVFDPSGRYLGKLDVGTQLNPIPRPVIRGDFLAALTESAEGAPQVVIYRIERAGVGNREMQRN